MCFPPGCDTVGYLAKPAMNQLQRQEFDSIPLQQCELLNTETPRTQCVVEPVEDKSHKTAGDISIVPALA